MYGTNVDAVAAAGTGRHKSHFGRRAGRPKPALRRDTLLGALGNLVEQAPNGVLEKLAALVQNEGSRLSCQRNAKRSFVAAAAWSQRFTRNGTSNRIVHASSLSL